MRSALVLALVGAMLLAGCANKGTQSISNNPDSFRYIADWENKVGTDRFPWKNSYGVAEVAVPGAGDAGSLRVVVKDASGNAVYDQTHTGASAMRERTSQAPAGDWSIELIFGSFRGHVEVNVRGVPPTTAP